MAGPKLLSVSAIRDYQKCGKYYELSRVLKAPEDRTTHHRWCGSLVHAAFMVAYGVPSRPEGDWRTSWQVDNAGTIDDALQVFDMLWEGVVDFTASERAVHAFGVLAPELPPFPAEQFASGSTKALKDPNATFRKEAWRTHFRKMLASELENGYAHPVKELEREVHYELGGVPMRGFIDVVLDGPDGEIYTDLKTGYNAPQPKLLAFDDQMGSYYHAAGPDGKKPAEVWYHHMRTSGIHAVPKSRNLSSLLTLAAQDVSEGIKAEYFPRRVTSECANCDRLKSCIKDARGKPVGSTPATDSSETAALLEALI